MNMVKFIFGIFQIHLSGRLQTLTRGLRGQRKNSILSQRRWLRDSRPLAPNLWKCRGPSFGSVLDRKMAATNCPCTSLTWYIVQPDVAQVQCSTITIPVSCNESYKCGSVQLNSESEKYPDEKNDFHYVLSSLTRHLAKPTRHFRESYDNILSIHLV